MADEIIKEVKLVLKTKALCVSHDESIAPELITSEQEITLSVDDARKLQDALNKLFGFPTEKVREYFPYPLPYPAYYEPYCWWYPGYTICGAYGGSISYSASSGTASITL